MGSEQKQHRDYWVGEVFFCDGHAWGVDESLKTLWLGKEEDILPVVKDEREMLNHLSPKQKLVLAQLLEIMEEQDAGTKQTRRFPITKRARPSFRGQYRYHR